METSAQPRASHGSKYEKIHDKGDETVEASYTRNPLISNLAEESLEVLEDSCIISSRGGVSQLLWLHFFIACMIFAFTSQSVVTDICGKYVARSVHQRPPKDVFHLIDNFRFVLMIPYTFIFASHSSMLMKRYVLFRFIDDRTRPDDESTSKSPPLIQRSFSAILMSFVAINLYLLLIQLGLLYFQLRMDSSALILRHGIFCAILSYAALFLYTYQIFDRATNCILVMCMAEVYFPSLSTYLWCLLLILALVQYIALHPREGPVTVNSSDVTHSTEASTASIHQSGDQSHPPIAGMTTSYCFYFVFDNLNPNVTFLLSCELSSGGSPVYPGGPLSISLMGVIETIIFVGMSMMESIIFVGIFGGVYFLLMFMVFFFGLSPPALQIYFSFDAYVLGFSCILAHMLMILSRRSILSPEYTVFRFKNENENEGRNETMSTVTNPTDRSTECVWLSCLSFLAYSRILQIVFAVLFHCASKLTGPIRSDISTPIMKIYFIAAILSYTYVVFDVRTNAMVVGAALVYFAQDEISERIHIDFLVLSVSFFFLIGCYTYQCCAPHELYSSLPQGAQHGAADAIYAPPILPTPPSPQTHGDSGSILEEGDARSNPK